MRNVRSRLGLVRLGLPVAALALLVALGLIWGSGPAKQASAHFPHPGVDFSIGVGTQCDSTAGPTTCTFNPGETFTVNFKLNTLPAGLLYEGYDMTVGFAGVDILLATLVQHGAGVWPSCVYAASAFSPGTLAAGCVSGGLPLSSYTGVLLHIDFRCPSTAGSGEIVLVHNSGPGVNGTDVEDHNLVIHGETDSIEPLTINCASPVGGISFDPQTGALPADAPSSSGSDAGLPAGAIAGAMAVVVITGGVWYARRRRVR